MKEKRKVQPAAKSDCLTRKQAQSAVKSAIVKQENAMHDYSPNEPVKAISVKDIAKAAENNRQHNMTETTRMLNDTLVEQSARVEEGEVVYVSFGYGTIPTKLDSRDMLTVLSEYRKLGWNVHVSMHNLDGVKITFEANIV